MTPKECSQTDGQTAFQFYIVDHDLVPKYVRLYLIKPLLSLIMSIANNIWKCLELQQPEIIFHSYSSGTLGLSIRLHWYVALGLAVGCTGVSCRLH